MKRQKAAPEVANNYSREKLTIYTHRCKSFISRGHPFDLWGRGVVGFFGLSRIIFSMSHSVQE